MEDNAAIPHSADGATLPRLNSALVTRWWWCRNRRETRPIFCLEPAGRVEEREWECWPHFNK